VLGAASRRLPCTGRGYRGMCLAFGDVAMLRHKHAVTNNKNRNIVKTKPACGWTSTRRPSDPATSFDVWNGTASRTFSRPCRRRRHLFSSFILILCHSVRPYTVVDRTVRVPESIVTVTVTPVILMAVTVYSTVPIPNWTPCRNVGGISTRDSVYSPILFPCQS
jgi:hypothetical protein